MNPINTLGNQLNKKMMDGMTSESKRVLGDITKDPAVESAVLDYGKSVSTTSYWFGVGVTVASAALAAGAVYIIDRAHTAWINHKIEKAIKEARETIEKTYDDHPIIFEDVNE